MQIAYTFRRKSFGGFSEYLYLCADKRKVTQPMKHYPDKMTPEQAQTFRDDVQNIVSQIPRCFGRLAEPFAHGRSHAPLYARS